MRFLNKTIVRKVLNAHAPPLAHAFSAPSLAYAFRWADTPQGADYWFERAMGEAPLTAEDCAFLESLLEDEE